MPGDDKLKPLPSGAFTSLPAGEEMGHHTNNAQAYLLEALTEMMQVLGLYREGVVAFKQGNVSHDQFSADELTRIARTVEQAGALNARDAVRGGDR